MPALVARDSIVPDVSVVVPLYNRARLVRYTLESLRAEHHPGVVLEVIVVDDGSTDGGGAAAVRDYPHVRLLLHENQGAPAARNAGIDRASADAILLLDSDDLVAPGFFEPRVQMLRTHSDADGAYGPWDHFASEREFAPATIVPRHTRYPIEEEVSAWPHVIRLLEGWYIAPQTLLWRRSALRRVSGQDVSLPVNQDVDLLFRVLISGAGIVGGAGPRALVREHVGVRQGVVGASREKAEAMLILRRRFVEVLESIGRLDAGARGALGRYCFDQWRALRRIHPGVASGFLALSRDLHPSLRLRGRWPLRLLASFVGPVPAARLRDALPRKGTMNG